MTKVRPDCCSSSWLPTSPRNYKPGWRRNSNNNFPTPLLGDFSLPKHKSFIEIPRRLSPCHEKCLQYPLYCPATSNCANSGNARLSGHGLASRGRRHSDPHDRSSSVASRHSGRTHSHPTNCKRWRVACHETCLQCFLYCLRPMCALLLSTHGSQAVMG